MDVSMNRARRPSLVRPLVPHLAWEALLLVSVVAVYFIGHAARPQLLSHGNIWPSLAAIGLVSAGLALSFRTGTPNLAVGMIAGLCAWWYADLVVHGSSRLTAGLVA